ncbi:DNA-directed RNA polymerase beta subunit [Klebsiella pneumoniae IS46]|nr:DNA-directed RNA polymerase beta subunit [Klebsiella pneumoniae IS46]
MFHFPVNKIVLHKKTALCGQMGRLVSELRNPMVYSYTEKKRIRKDFGKTSTSSGCAISPFYPA